MWKLLLEGVTWTSPPLFNFEQTRNELVSVLGPPPAVNLDSNGIGLFDGWALAFPCGLEMTLSIFHIRDIRDGISTKPDEPAMIEVHANTRDFEHLRFHMPVPTGEIWRWTPDPLIASPKTWVVVRQDDNGHRYEIGAFTSSCEADAAAKAFEARGHKQMYWVEGPAPRS